MLEEIKNLIIEEEERQSNQLSLIASENYTSKAVRDASGSMLTNKYAEGYPGARYYAGNFVVDKIENKAISLAQELFETNYHVNVQPYSGSTANLAIYAAFLKPGDTVLAMSLDHGGHLTHGHKVSYTGQIYNFVHYGVSKDTELIDYDQVMALAMEHKPKMIVCGGSAYPALINFQAFARVARVTGALLMVDMSHFAGLVAGKAHPSPFNHADVIMTTTHKTLRGPRGAVIFTRPEFAALIDKAVFPGLQGGPHMHIIAAKAVAFAEALQPSFAQYATQVIKNAKSLAFTLQRSGLRLVSDGTETHLLLLDLRSIGLGGKEAQERLEEVGIICNKNMIPFDPAKPNNPSGIRLGTAGVTTRGMKETDMDWLGGVIISVLETSVNNPNYTTVIEQAKSEVQKMTKRFRIPVV